MSKYLAYAIGEILLVMIGILLALQVNNWNEARKIQEKEKVYLNQLQAEFKKDSSGLQFSRALAESKISQAEYVINEITSATIEVDSVSFMKNAFLIGRGAGFKPYIPTYEELISGGQFSIINNKKLSNTIRSYMNRMDGLDRFSFQEGSNRKKDYNTHLFQYFSAEIMPVFWKSNRSDSAFYNAVKNFRMDFQGFKKDPQSLMHIQNVKAADMEMLYLYKQSNERYLIPIMDLLDKEVNG